MNLGSNIKSGVKTTYNTMKTSVISLIDEITDLVP